MAKAALVVLLCGVGMAASARAQQQADSVYGDADKLDDDAADDADVLSQRIEGGD